MIESADETTAAAKRAHADTLDSLYLWLSRFTWPIISLLSWLTAYWSFALSDPGLVVKAAGVLFALFGVVSAASSVCFALGGTRQEGRISRSDGDSAARVRSGLEANWRGPRVAKLTLKLPS
jgi:hypothetical protein